VPNCETCPIESIVNAHPLFLRFLASGKMVPKRLCPFVVMLAKNEPRRQKVCS